MIRTLALTAAALTAAAAPPPPAAADNAAPKRIQPQRLVHHFDFDERDIHFEDLPMHWYVIGRPAQTTAQHFDDQPLHRELVAEPGFPRFTEVTLDQTHAAVGQHSFLLALDGGSAGAFLETGTIPVMPGSDYLVTAQVRTEALRFAGAQLTAYFITDEGERIPASVQQTPPRQSNDAWTTVGVQLRGDFRDAAYLGLELTLRQPGRDPRHPLGRHQIQLTDIRGRVWFDDIRVWQVPHLELNTQSRVNIVRAPDRPRLDATTRDLSSQPLASVIRVYDHRRRLVDTHRRTGGEQRGRGSAMSWTPELPAFGWYLADFQIFHASADGQPAPDEPPLARTLTAFLYLPDHEPTPGEPDHRRFGLIAEDMPEPKLALLPELVDATRTRRTVISAFDRATREMELDVWAEDLDTFVQQLASDSGGLSLSLHPLPRQVTEQHPGRSGASLELFSRDADRWLAYLAPIAMRHGPRVDRWHLGPPGSARLDGIDQLPRQLRQLVDELASLAPDPTLVTPWPLELAPPRGLADAPVAFLLELGPDAGPEATRQYLEPWADAGLEGWASLRESGADELSHVHRVRGLALRMIAAWKAQPAGLKMESPWTADVGREPGLVPDPLLGVFTNVRDRLAGRRHVGELPLGDGIRALIFDGPAGGMLAVWNESAESGDAVLDLHLGENPVAIDVWGNRRALSARNGRHYLSFGPTPLFIEGIDANLALFRSRFTLTPELVPSRRVPHHHTLRLANPWDQTISGRLRFTGPEAWDVQPAQHHFSIPAGGETELSVQLQFPILEVAGPKQLEARIELAADRHYEIDVAAPMRLGLEKATFDASVSLAENGRDAQVVALVTNTGDEAISLQVFANLRGHPRQERLIPRLEPGESVVRRFRFEDAAATLAEHPMRAGIRETDGPAMLNTLLHLNEQE